MPTLIELSRRVAVLHDALLICGWRLIHANQSTRQFRRQSGNMSVWLSSRGAMSIGKTPATAMRVVHPEEFVKAAAGQASRPGMVDAGFIAAACEWLGFHQLELTPRVRR